MRQETPVNLSENLLPQIRQWATELGFQALGVSGVDLGDAGQGLQRWLQQGFHGEMDYMERHGLMRSQPAQLVPGTRSVIAVRMNYLPPSALPLPGQAQRLPATQAVIARYALGGDYHKLMRRRLQQLADRISDAIGPFGYRVFSDSAPVMEVELARRAGLGWRGKHTLMLSRNAGSFFFLGELFTDLPLPPSLPQSLPEVLPQAPNRADASADNDETGGHCGTCTQCLQACPTGAIVAPYRLDARRCISYLTIELKGSIPTPLRSAIGNRVYGCDDCQTVCPWNKYAQVSPEQAFAVRHGLDRSSLLALFQWSEPEFLERMQGSAIRRIGHVRWLRNLAVGLGNALSALQDTPETATQRAEIRAALQARQDHPSALLREHVAWALAQG
jgi:epoxyqueuosine reductase